MAVNGALVKLLRKPEYANLDDAAALALALDETVEVIDHTRRTFVDLFDQFTMEEAGLVMHELTQRGLGWVQAILTTPGLDFADSQTRAALGQLAGSSLPSGLLARLSALGIRHISPYHEAGGADTPTLEDVADSRARVVADAVLSFIVRRYNRISVAADAGAYASIAEAVAALGAPPIGDPGTES